MKIKKIKNSISSWEEMIIEICNLGLRIIDIMEDLDKPGLAKKILVLTGQRDRSEIENIREEMEERISSEWIGG